MCGTPFRRASIALVPAVVVALLTPAFSAAGAPTADGVRRAASRYERAIKLLDERTPDTHRLAIEELVQATLLDPGNPLYELTLARAYYQSGHLGEARHRFERVVAITPEDAEGHYGLGQVWRRDWLHYLDPTSLDRAIDQLTACCRLRPDHTDGWLLLVPLLMEKKDTRAAYLAAKRAYESDVRHPEPELAVAYTAYRMGYLTEADSAFRDAVPRLPKSARERFEDISPVATERDTFTLHRLPPAQQAEFVRRFWTDMDPDLVTSVNEAQLEYEARVAHAYFLFYNPKLREWDERGEIYVRYGPPEAVVYNPVGTAQNFHFTVGPVFPANVLIWAYPSLGMAATLIDRTLSEYYLLPPTRDYDPDPLPNPAVMAQRSDALVARSGRGVFATLPPGIQPLEVSGAVARFEGGEQPVLKAQVEAPASPDDSLFVDWTVLDSTRRVVKRGSDVLIPSACDPAELKVADLSTSLEPGPYNVGLAVHDRRGRRGVFRTMTFLAPPSPLVSVSDILITCGAPIVSDASVPVVRPEPNPSARIGYRGALTAYFEIYHLRSDASGLARFEYHYRVRSTDKDPRIWIQRLIAPHPAPPEIAVEREESQIGGLRRQFVNVPVQTLPAGHYRLEITVRDLVANSEATSSADFVKLGTLFGP